MLTNLRNSVPYPIPSLDTLITYLKHFPPSNPAYVRLVESRYKPYTDADIFDLVNVPPEEIQYCSPRFDHKWELAGRVVGGDWDQDPTPYEEAAPIAGVSAPFHPSLVSHFEEGVPWEQTPFVEGVLDCIAEGREAWTCSTPSEVAEKCQRVDDLYEQIDEHGYMSRAEQLQAGIPNLKSSRQSVAYRLLQRYTVVGKDEIKVNIGRDGRLLRFSGKHRLSIAKILDLDTIPVLVLARHEGWQEIRDTLRTQPNPEMEVAPGLRTHPDLQDLLPENVQT